MKRILCFGDSNTYGFIPENAGRYDRNTRWTGVLANLLVGKCEIVEAGCNNRTCIADNSDGVEFTGYKILPKILNISFDIVILSVGTNDLQSSYDITLDELKKGMDFLISITKLNAPNAEIILLSPAKLRQNVLNSFFASKFNIFSIEKSKHFPEIYKDISQKQKCFFIDLNEIVEVSSVDGLHFSAQAHEKIAFKIYSVINSILSKKINVL